MTRPCALYRLYAGAELVYIGIAYDPAQRIRAHRRRLTWSRVVVRWYPDRQTARFLERLAILVERPSANVKDAGVPEPAPPRYYGVVRGMFAVTPFTIGGLFDAVPPAVHA